MSEFLKHLHELKGAITAGAAIVALLLDKELGPAEDDLPLRWKMVLVVPVVAGAYYPQHLTDEQRQAALPYLLGLFTTSFLVYAAMWKVLGYEKQTAKPRPWWTFWSKDPYDYPKVRVMGGRLLPRARDVVRREGITVQELFQGTAYDQDQVWGRFSRACAQVALALVYMAVVLFYVATIASAI